MTISTSRRAILAGAAALPALALPAAAMSGGIDPIFGAIEKHKAAFRISQAAGRIRFHTIDAEWSPRYDPVECKAAIEADRAATDTADAAAGALTTIRPTTIAGILALMRYVEAFNAGAFALDIDRDNWRSGPMHWPAYVDENEENEVDMFGYSILANVRAALESLAVQS